jgi:Dolichyl-phosphate-mannose-protein mannosyltransferase
MALASMPNEPSHTSRWPLALLGISALAAFLFLWQLGSSSFFIDETSSMRLVEGPLGDLLSRLRVAENSPAGYFAALHVWTQLAGSTSEWVARLPSALAGIALVPAVWWLAQTVDGRRAALVAALLTAISPLMLQYAQQARAYMPAMLALTLAATAAIRAARTGSVRWAVAGAAACALALSLHYVALVVVVPLCMWVLLRGELALRTRLVFCLIPGVVWLAWLPLALAQRADHPSAQLGQYGTFTAGHLVRVAAAPFDDRYTVHAGALKAAAALAVAVAVVVVLLRSRAPERRELRLLLALVVVSGVVLCVGALAGIEILNSRYMTFAAPFMLVIAGVAVAHSPPPLALSILVVLVAAGVVYTAGSHRREGYYPDVRGAIASIDSGWRDGDVVLEQSTLGVQFPLAYYAKRDLPPGTRVTPLTDTAAAGLLENGSRAWIVRDESLAPAGGAAPPNGYRRIALRRFPSSSEVTVELAAR